MYGNTLTIFPFLFFYISKLNLVVFHQSDVELLIKETYTSSN
jgi:hypothetical protein